MGLQRTDHLTRDEPYLPAMVPPADAAEIVSSTRPGSSARPDPASAAPWRGQHAGEGRSLLPPIDAAFAARLEKLNARLRDGKTLGIRDLEDIAIRGAFRLLASRRPSGVAVAVGRLVELVKAREERRVKRAERRRARAQSRRYRLALPADDNDSPF